MTITRQAGTPPTTDTEETNLYLGSAGIALFLAEAYRVAGDPALRIAAIEGGRGALRDPIVPDARAYAFHAGYMGRLYAAARIGEICDDSHLLERACIDIARLDDARPTPRGFDVIGGVAGAIPALHLLASKGIPRAQSLAIWLTQTLLTQAHRLPDGWAWGGGEGCQRFLAGYSHGAAGAALALAETAQVTNDGQHWYAAYRGFAYDQAAYDPIQRNWRDYRQTDLLQLYLSGDYRAIRESMANGEAFEWQHDKAMAAWCHGAPGIGLSRLRAYQLTGDTDFLAEGLIATETTASTLQLQTHANFSLCHGVPGNCETLIMASTITGDSTHLQQAQETMLAGAELYEFAGREWPSGALHSIPQASLLLGDAGTGYGFLRAADVGTPSILLVTPPCMNQSAPHFDLHVAWEDRGAFWHRTRSAVRQWQTTDTADTREQLEDALAIDSLEHELLTTRMALTVETIEHAISKEQLDDTVLPRRLSHRVSMVPVRWRWSSTDDTTFDGPDRCDPDSVAVVSRQRQQVAIGYASGLSRLILEILREPHTLDELLDAVYEQVEVAPVDQLREATKKFWDEAWRFGLLTYAFNERLSNLQR